MYRRSSRSSQGRALGGRITAGREPVDYYARTQAEVDANNRRALASIEAALQGRLDAKTRRELERKARDLRWALLGSED